MVGSFFKSKEEKDRGIYLALPIGDDEERMKMKSGTSFVLKRPHLTVLLMIIGMATFVICIGSYMYFINNNRSTYAAYKNGNQSPNLSKIAPLILISIDGFRYDYLHRGVTPNLKKLTKLGIHGPMKPQFPSYTFPNHYTLVTGLYPESHGIVANAFYDPKLKEYFSYTNQKDLKESKWWQAEPIWNAVQRFGMRSATMFWPGSESSILGKRPNYFKTYDGEISTDDRVDQVLKWLDLPLEKRPQFISLYLSLVDDAGHLYGPDSKEVDKALKEVDLGIGRLIEGLKRRKLIESANILVVSDHGMVEIKEEERFHIYLDDLIPNMKERLQWVDFGPMASIIPLEGEEDSIYTELVQAKMRGYPFMVYMRDELPPDFHYKSNDRIAPIIIVAKKGWVIDFRGGDWVPRGAHGYDPNLPEMQALLIASGPEFRDFKHSSDRIKKGNTRSSLKGISNLDVYPLMMHLLKITAPPNNGTLSLVNLIK